MDGLLSESIGEDVWVIPEVVDLCRDQVDLGVEGVNQVASVPSARGVLRHARCAALDPDPPIQGPETFLPWFPFVRRQALGGTHHRFADHSLVLTSNLEEVGDRKGPNERLVFREKPERTIEEHRHPFAEEGAPGGKDRVLWRPYRYLSIKTPPVPRADRAFFWRKRVVPFHGSNQGCHAIAAGATALWEAIPFLLLDNEMGQMRQREASCLRWEGREPGRYRSSTPHDASSTEPISSLRSSLDTPSVSCRISSELRSTLIRLVRAQRSGNLRSK